MSKTFLKASFLAATMMSGAAHADNPLKDIGDHIEKGATGEAKRAGTEAVQGVIGNVIGGVGRVIGVDIGDCRQSSSTGVYSGTRNGAYENTRNTKDCNNNNSQYRRESVQNRQTSEIFNACSNARYRVERNGGHPIYDLDAHCQQVLYGGVISAPQSGHNYQQAPQAQQAGRDNKSVNDLLRSMRSR